MIPYVRQAAKIQAAEAAEHALKEAAKASRAAEAGEAPPPPLTFREKLEALKNAKADEGAEEVNDELGEPVEPVSPWLGFQALGIATAIVGVSAGLGVWGAAKWLGVNSVSSSGRQLRLRFAADTRWRSLRRACADRSRRRTPS